MGCTLVVAELVRAIAPRLGLQSLATYTALGRARLGATSRTQMFAEGPSFHAPC